MAQLIMLDRLDNNNAYSGIINLVLTWGYLNEAKSKVKVVKVFT